MPLNESKIPRRRDRWPLEFDLEGIPRDTATRKRLLEEMREKMAVRNNFAVDRLTPAQKADLLDALLKEAGNSTREIDINNPPKKPYVFQKFPMVLYNHKTGEVITVESDEELAAEEKKGLKATPSALFDYSRTRNGKAPKKTVKARQVAIDEDELEAGEAAKAAEFRRTAINT